MGRKKVTIDDLYDEIRKTLEDYEADVEDVLETVTVDYGKIGVRMLREESPKRTGKYAKGWAYSKKKTKDNTAVIIHNKSKPTLTHLLENGHAKRNGGRVPGIKHIEPVNNQLSEEFAEAVENGLLKIDAK